MTEQRQSNSLVTFLTGLVAGLLLAGVGGWLMMPGLMLEVHESRYDSVEETTTRLMSAIKANGWATPGARNMNKTMAKHGVQMERQVRVVELCNASYAKDIISTNPEVSTLMPCAWGVYEGDNSKIYISGMNMGLMGKMFGGNIARIMEGFVSKDEARILSEVIVRQGLDFLEIEKPTILTMVTGCLLISINIRVRSFQDGILARQLCCRRVNPTDVWERTTLSKGLTPV